MNSLEVEGGTAVAVRFRLSPRGLRRTLTRVNGNPGMPPGDFVRLVVSDNGSGLDQETAARIFEPFFATQDIGRGVGIGLATVHSAITQSGGFIDIDSKPGRGTAFFIYLPRYLGATGQRGED